MSNDAWTPRPEPGARIDAWAPKATNDAWAPGPSIKPKIPTGPAVPAPRGPQKKSQSGLGMILDTLDVPLSLASAAYDSLPDDGPHDAQALQKAIGLLRRGGPAALNAQYNPTDPRVMARQAQQYPDDALVQARAHNPWVAGATNFGLEMLNPSNVVLGPIGAIAGRGVKAAGQLARRVSAIDRAATTVGTHVIDPVANSFSRFRPLRQRAGIRGEITGRRMAARTSQAATEAQAHTQHIFGPIPRSGTGLATRFRNAVSPVPLSRDEQIEIVRRSQGLAPHAMPAAHDAELSARASELRSILKNLDRQQLAANPKLLKHVSNPDQYFPMYGQYLDPSIGDEERELLAELNPQSRGNSMSTRLGTGSGRLAKVHPTMDEALQSQALRPDFSPPEAFMNHYARRMRNVEFENAIRNAPNSLAKKITPGMYDEEGHLQVPLGYVRGEEVQNILGSSPTATEHVLAPELVAFIKDAGAPAQEAGQVGKFIDTVNRLTRIGVITNPVVHPAWNLLGNYLGAKGDIGKLGYIASGRGWAQAPFWEQLAADHGAQVHFAGQGLAGTNMGRIIGGEGSPLERVSTRAWEANQRLVFDTFEKRFSTALFHDKYQELAKKGVAQTQAFDRAGIEVRKILGDYDNVNKTGLEGKLNKAFFFYPWLKTVVSQWTKNLIHNPSSVSAPARAVSGWNGALGDPNAHTGAFTLYEGKDKSGQDQYASLPVPQRILSHLAEIVAPGGDLGGPLAGRAKAVMDIASGHANPGLSQGIDAIYTQAAPAQEPGSGNFHIAYNKDAPIAETIAQAAKSATGKILPPAIRGLTDNAGDIAKGDLSSLQGLAGVNSYKLPPEGKSRAIFRLQTRFMRRIKQLRSDGDNESADKLFRIMQELEKQMEGN